MVFFNDQTYCFELDGENIEKEIKTVYLDYRYMGKKKKWVYTFEAFDLKEFDGEWKIIDIRDSY